MLREEHAIRGGHAAARLAGLAIRLLISSQLERNRHYEGGCHSASIVPSLRPISHGMGGEEERASDS